METQTNDIVDGESSAGPEEDSEESLLALLREALRDLFAAIMRPEEQPKMEEMFPNDLILGYSTADLPSTLQEVHNNRPLTSNWWLTLNVEKLHKWRDLFTYIRNVAFFKELRHAAELHEDLAPIPASPAELRDVWVLCRRRTTAVEAWRHWSVLTQGRIFHLTARKANGKHKPYQSGEAVFETSNTTGFSNAFSMNMLRVLLNRTKAKVIVPIERGELDFSSPTSKHSIADHSRRMKFVAYHVGCTAFTAEEVSVLAGAVIWQMEANNMGSYDIFQNNCQHFVLALIRRIVMTQRKPIAVGGTRLQLAQWDMGLPGYELKPWLTNTKARLLLLSRESKKGFRKRNLRTVYFGGPGPHFKQTLPKVLGSIFYEKDWAKALKKIRESSTPLIEIKGQIKNMYKDVEWRRTSKTLVLMSWSYLILSVVTLLTLLGNETSPETANATLMAFLPWALASEAAFHAYIWITRLFYNRGSLTIRHFDLKRTNPGRFELSDERPPEYRRWNELDDDPDAKNNPPSDGHDSHDVDHRDAKDQSLIWQSDSDSDIDGADAEEIIDERLYPFNQSILRMLEPRPIDEELNELQNLGEPPPYDSEDDAETRPLLPPRHALAQPTDPLESRPPLPPRHVTSQPIVSFEPATERRGQRSSPPRPKLPPRPVSEPS